VPKGAGYRDYTESVHGRKALAGDPEAPLCQDCHGTHDIKAPADSASSVFKLNMPKTCGRCHLEVYAQYAASVHGVALLEEGNLDAPSCADCHGEHKILEPSAPGSSVYATRVPATCGTCHAAEGTVGKYGIETSRVKTYQESYHGVAVEFGARTVANCARCHGAHDIRPPEDTAPG